MKVNQIRRAFLDFFASKQHTIVESSSLIPHNDPTLLFTNSGMVQFKDVFLGKENKSYIRATSSQRSVRAGGKHNDLENVGYTARHHTFFEMLGNFSFGDYFKQQAIHYAWELLTKVYALPAKKLYVTVYIEDDEAYAIWLNEIGVPAEHIIRIGDNKGARYASDNFWQMADTGPCGPCSEIFYDHGEGIYGGLPGSAEEDGDRFIEVWNLVFMQFSRDEQGVLTPLPKPCVDTGMGLERIAAVLQHVNSNYDIDLFTNLIQVIARIVQTHDLKHNSLKVIADHLRAICFLIVDGVVPSNEGRGYVLRRILRRAIRHGYKLNMRVPFIYQLVDVLIQEMGDAYPELRTKQIHIQNIIQQEEQRFFETLFNGMDMLEHELNTLETKQKNHKELLCFSGEVAFKLHDTYGFPLDLTADICRERNITVNQAEFEQHMQKQKDMARAAGKFKALQQLNYEGEDTYFSGYVQSEDEACIVAIYIDGEAVTQIQQEQSGVIILDRTPFYAESGGQIGDSGFLKLNSSVFIVEDTQKIGQAIGHYGYIKQGCLEVGKNIQASINQNQRIATQRNHSATHLLHKALYDVLGEHVQQKGSLVDADKLRFDFSHHQNVTSAQLLDIEQKVNQQILQNIATNTQMMAFDDAKNAGAMALFGEKYTDTVRVLSIGNSKELCGGTHVNRTGDIGLFKIISEVGIAAGVRRIEAVTGLSALNYLQELEHYMQNMANHLKVPVQIHNNLKTQQKQLQQTELQIALLQCNDAIQQAHDIGSIHYAAKLMIVHVNYASYLRDIADDIKQKCIAKNIDYILLLIYTDTQNNKVNVLVNVANALQNKIAANTIATSIAKELGGKGGGKIDLAQGGGTNVAAIPQALNVIEALIKEALV
jgi:alanyl-tRNA synthetase